MDDGKKDDATSIGFREERLALEREQLAIERERLAAERAHAEAAAHLASARHRRLGFLSVLLFAAFSFAGGVLVGMNAADARNARQRDDRLRMALQKFGRDSVSTNAPSSGTVAPLSVIVFQ